MRMTPSPSILIRAVLPLLVLPGCRVAHPPGYLELASKDPHLTAQRVPGPGQWEFSDARRVSFDLQRSSRASGMGVFRLELRFEVMFTDASEDRLACKTLPDEPFACRSTGAGTPWTVAITPRDGCKLKDLATVQTLLDPLCWKGNVITTGGTYDFEFAYLQGSRRAPQDAAGTRGRGRIDRIVWTNADGDAVQALDAVSEVRVELYRAGALPEDDGDALLLSAMALHQWVHSLWG